MLHSLGEVSLTISTIIYFFWFVPQIALNFRRRKTAGVSLWMHGLLMTGYLADLMYGFGRHMPIQYRLVTITGLLFLTVEHYQFLRYGLRTREEKVTFHVLNIIFIALFAYAIASIINGHSKQFYDMAGLVSNVCWFSYTLPQIIKNYVNKSTEGLSFTFVLLSVISGICDVISAYTLGWDWPSRLGAPIGLVKKSLLLTQFNCYKQSASKVLHARSLSPNMDM